MMHSNTNRAFQKNRIEQAIKKELVLLKLENTLGKPKQELQSIISKGLLDILTQVPFSYRNR